MPKAATPSVEDLRQAAVWCDHYEGSEDDMAPFKRVAQWLEEQAGEKELRELAKEHGVPVGKLRKAMQGAR